MIAEADFLRMRIVSRQHTFFYAVDDQRPLLAGNDQNTVIGRLAITMANKQASRYYRQDGFQEVSFGLLNILNL